MKKIANKFGCVLLVCIGACGSLQATDETEHLEPRLQMLKAAAGVSDVKFVDIPINAPIVGFEILVEGYKDGRVVFNERSTYAGRPSVTMNSPTMAVEILVCICRRLEKTPEVTTIGTNKTRLTPGTGSTRLGYSFRITSKNGYSASGGHVEVPHATVDFLDMQDGRKCEGAPFKIRDSHRVIPAIPLLVYFPRKGDLTSLKGDIDAVNLPDGTFVVYAMIKKE